MSWTGLSTLCLSETERRQHESGREDREDDLDLMLASELLRSRIDWTGEGSWAKAGVGEGKRLEMSRMPTSSSSEKSEVSLRSEGVGIR